MRKELQKDIEDTRDIISSLSIPTTSIVNHSVSAPFAPADPDNEGDDWEAEVERCAQELAEAERVEEGTSESEVADIVLDGQSVAASPPILCTDMVNVHEDGDSCQADLFENIARGAQAMKEPEQRVEESIPEAESKATPPSDLKGVVESPVFDAEDPSALLKPDSLRNLASVDPTALADRAYHPEYNLPDCDNERLETEEQYEEAPARWDEEDKEEEEALGRYDVTYPSFDLPSGGEGDGEVDMEIEEDDHRRTFPVGRSLPSQGTVITNASGPQNDEENTVPSYGSLEPIHTAYERGEWQCLTDIEPPFERLPTSNWEPGSGDNNTEVDMDIDEDNHRQRFPAPLHQTNESSEIPGSSSTAAEDFSTYGSLEALHTAYGRAQWESLANVEPPFNVTSPHLSQQEDEDTDAEMNMEIEEEDYSRRGMQSHGSLEPIHALYRRAQWQPLNDTELPFSHLSDSYSF
ncbi:hypothetical protein NEOLEDRAFT_273894 [Neolentinus lepideus HHB14362 ss-1]|uniref:Uncharacterized protein n=1 Tax=Neolentinus lepideus HHB14362 ss-1 TaxID=1314782 RepID=A0A165T5E7_9AGAM|nr:hypothetical protein NEOLEDRAFT_273894 [Neolentinus lepideus HHB14362 ss-1]